MTPQAAFRQQLQDRLSLSELKTLCFDLQIDYETLSGHDNKVDLARHLLTTSERRDQLAQLHTYCQKQYPDITWVNPQPPLTPAPSHPTSRLPNPFITRGRLNQPEAFFGRDRLRRELQQELSKRSSVSLVGPSQVGKSSLLYYLYQTRTLWATEMQIEYVDLQGVLDEEDFCETVLQKIGQQGHTLRDLKRGLSRYHGVLLLDEVERIAEDDFNPRLHDLLRSLAQERHFALCTATRHALEEVFPADRLISAFHNIFTVKWLGNFSQEESLAFLDWALRAYPLQFTASEKMSLYEQSQGHPAQLQQAAKAMFNRRFAGG